MSELEFFNAGQGVFEAPPAEPLDELTCVLRYAVQTSLGGIIVIERPVPLRSTLEDFVRDARLVLREQDGISLHMLEKYVVKEHMATAEGVPLSCLHDWFHLMPSSVVCVTDTPGSCHVLSRCHIAWRVALEGGMTCVVWARVANTLVECKANLFEQLRTVGIVHSDSGVTLYLLSRDGFRTPIVSPRQMFCGTVFVPGAFKPSEVPAVVMQHPDMFDFDASGVFDSFLQHGGNRVVDSSRWD